MTKDIAFYLLTSRGNTNILTFLYSKTVWIIVNVFGNHFGNDFR